MQRYFPPAVIVIVLVISSCTEHSDAQDSTDRIVAIGKLIPSAHNEYPGSKGTTFLLTGSRLPDGVMFALSAHIKSTQPVRFQVWRPTNESSTYRLVWQHRYVSPAVDEYHQRQDIYFYNDNDTQCFHFRHDDRVGVFTESLPAAIPYQFLEDTKTVFVRPSGPVFEKGDEANFNTLGLPFHFSVQAYVDTVNGLYENDTSEYVPCPRSTIPEDLPSHGATGATGPRGATGPAGPKGDAGPVGPQGPPGKSENSLTGSLTSNSTSGPTMMMSIIALVWLCLLTLAVVVVILLYFFFVRRRQKDAEDLDSEVGPASNHHKMTRERSKTSSVRDDEVWFSDLKEETESQYSVGTKETTPLSKTGPFVFEGPYEADQTDSNPQLHNGQTPANAAATLDLSAPAAQY